MPSFLQPRLISRNTVTMPEPNPLHESERGSLPSLGLGTEKRRTQIGRGIQLRKLAKRHTRRWAVRLVRAPKRFRPGRLYNFVWMIPMLEEEGGDNDDGCMASCGCLIVLAIALVVFFIIGTIGNAISD